MWSDRFIGTPYAPLGRDSTGCDCWGLACIIYREELGITLPDYLGYGSVEEHGEIAALIAGATASPLWLPVNGPALAFDIAVFRRGRLSSHVGIVIRHGVMIHMHNEDRAALADYRSGAWRHRLAGHYRHRSTPVERPVQFISEAGH